ncbi:MAG: hypothetical protein ACOC38_08815 [Promethearchaeia archaeon]
MQNDASSNNNELENLDAIESELKGNTLLIYWLMLRENRPLRAREIQRLLNLSSSSLALHHLNKLIDLNLVATNAEGYYVVKHTIRPGLLGLFMGTGYLFVPRFIFYAALNTALLISCLYVFQGLFDAAILMLLLVLLINCIILWAETIQLWRLQPL